MFLSIHHQILKRRGAAGQNQIQGDIFMLDLDEQLTDGHGIRAGLRYSSQLWFSQQIRGVSGAKTVA
jgi:hypothetical protein